MGEEVYSSVVVGHRPELPAAPQSSREALNGVLPARRLVLARGDEADVLTGGGAGESTLGHFGPRLGLLAATAGRNDQAEREDEGPGGGVPAALSCMEIRKLNFIGVPPSSRKKRGSLR